MDNLERALRDMAVMLLGSKEKADVALAMEAAIQSVSADNEHSLRNVPISKRYRVLHGAVHELMRKTRLDSTLHAFYLLDALFAAEFDFDKAKEFLEKKQADLIALGLASASNG